MIFCSFIIINITIYVCFFQGQAYRHIMSMRTPLANSQPTHGEQYTILGTVAPMTDGTLPPRFTAQTSTVSSAFLSPRQRAATPPVSVPTAPLFPFDDQTVLYSRTGTRPPFLPPDMRAVSAPLQFPMDMDTVGHLVEARATMDGDVDMNTPVGSPKSPMTDQMSYMNSPEHLTMLSQKAFNMNRSGGDDDDGTETSTQDCMSYMNSPEHLTMLSKKTLNMNRSGGGDDDDDSGTETSTQDLSSTSSIGCSVLDWSQNLSPNLSQNLSQY